ncbi:MAG: hypothetical protein Pg6C_17810 [Treponemataceae bacterium]|nr:MAG: hypothetical protein Pg6C_17810 [Treponemataceae bacterium]
MSGEIVIDGVSYIKTWENPIEKYYGDPSEFMKNNFTDEEYAVIRKKLMAHLVEAGRYVKKSDWEKQRPKTYTQGNLFDEDEA